MPQGLFRGKSKQVYDYLYHQTRGAITPKRSVRKSRKEILKGSGLGSMVTVDAAIEHLKNVGLLDVRAAVGSLNGNEYEVFTPEESSTRLPSYTSTTSLTQNLDNLDVLESSSTSITQTHENINSYGSPNTKIKDKDLIDDDARAGRLSFKLREAERELTGKTSTDDEKWDELAEVLVTELKIAAARTTISNVPAFLAEHLRRRLWKLDKARAAEMNSSQPEQGAATRALTAEEKQKCPDCAGVGFWYPEGTEKGVARCAHLKLQAVPEGQ
jgi:vacuolar-type H+-ATPase subunit I/STV1